MSFHNDNTYKHGTPVDYDPETKSWSKRETDQVMPCHLSYGMNLLTNPGDQNDIQDVLSLDGRHKRVIAINGVSPGLPLVVPLGSEVLLRVRNMMLMDAVTVHVHGLDKAGLWYTDGVAYVQQCPVPSMNYYEYRFIADTKGTHWYHGHMQSDRGDGLLGGFIVVDKNDTTVPIDEKGTREKPQREYSVILQDWATVSAEEAWMQLDDKTMKWMYGYDDFTQCWQPTRLIDGGNVGGAVPISAILINDKGWYNQTEVLNRPQNLPLERFKIKRGETVLFRIVNGGVAQELMVHIEGHQMLVVAADGSEVVPQPVDRFIVFPGERYDILVRGLMAPTKKSYKMQVETIQYYAWNWTVIDTTYGVAFVEYEDTNLLEDTSKPNYLPTECTPESRCTVLNCPFESYPSNYNYTCISYDQLRHPTPQVLEDDLLQDTAFTEGFEEHFINMHFDSHVDGYKFEFPSGMPYYYKDNMNQITKPCNASLCPRGAVKYDRNCDCFYHKKHKLGNIVQITVFNMGTGGKLGTGYAHPFHIHGTHFSVMKVGWPSYNASGMIAEMNPDLACPGPVNDDGMICDGAVWANKSWMNGAVQGMNTVNPSSRDTITLPVGGYITIRFRAKNAGWWFAHCHLVLHHMGGTAYAFKIGEDSDIPPPPDNFPHGCGHYSMPSIPKPTLKTPTASSGIHSLLSFCILVIISHLY